MKRIPLAMVVLLLASPNAVRAGSIVNGSFETGDLTGWTYNVPGLTIINGPPPDTIDYLPPTDGKYLAYVQGGLQDVYVTLSQTFTANPGDTLSFDTFFQAGDYRNTGDTYNDKGYAEVIDPSNTPTVLFKSSVTDLPPIPRFGNTGWKHETYLIPTAGSYTVQIGVVNIGDGNFASSVGLDNVRLIPPPRDVPEIDPGSALNAIALMGLGLPLVRRRPRA